MIAYASNTDDILRIEITKFFALAQIFRHRKTAHVLSELFRESTLQHCTRKYVRHSLHSRKYFQKISNTSITSVSSSLSSSLSNDTSVSGNQKHAIFLS